MAKPQDLTLQQFGQLTVISRHPENTKANKTQWLCRCTCGGEKVVVGASLKNGLTQSCGCYHKRVVQKMGRANRTHGHADDPNRTREYRIWTGMKARCNNENRKDYDLYGGRGIKVCDRWNSFENFLADMGLCPETLTIDRINPDGNYEPGNCRWATVLQQNRNRNFKRRQTRREPRRKPKQ